MILGMGLICACASLVPEATPSLPTATATITPTGTETIVWFPPTETMTPFPTREILPTAEMAPGIAASLLENGFGENQSWRTGTYASGNISQVDQSLILAVQKPKDFLITFLSGLVFEDFDLQVTANMSLCRGSDSYAILVRSLSEYDYYRFLVNCQGEARAERIRSGQTIPLQDWTPADIIIGAATNSKIEIWASGSEMRLIINDSYLFSVKDPSFRNGQIGLFARSAGDNALTVTFRDLTVYALDPQLIPSATPTP